MKSRIILIFSPPGSGKETQGAAFGALPRFYHGVGAEMFHSMDTRAPIGREFLKYSSKGALAPDRDPLTFCTAKRTIKENRRDGASEAVIEKRFQTHEGDRTGP